MKYYFITIITGSIGLWFMQPHGFTGVIGFIIYSLSEGIMIMEMYDRRGEKYTDDGHGNIIP